MSRHITTGLLFMVITSLTLACDDALDITPPASLTEDDFFKTPEDAAAALTAAYRPLLNTGNYAKIIEAPTDDILIHNTQGLWLDSWGIVATDPLIDEVWQSLYEGVFRANLVIQNVPPIEMAEAAKERIVGEARLLRAFYYWQLTTLFGDVPLVTEADVTDVSNAMLPKREVSDIFASVIEDLRQAIDALPAQSELGTADIGRVTSGAAQALLGKVYLYAEDYPMAEQLLDMVITSGEYGLLPDFGELLVADNNDESILEVQFEDLPGQGTSRMVNDYPQGQGGFANLLPTRDLVDTFEAHSGSSAVDGSDARLFYSVFRDGDPYDDVEPAFREAWTPTGYARKKGMYPVVRVNNSNMGRNFPLIRLADVLLMYAEAANENGKSAEAVAAINRVRGRVGMPPLPNAELPAGTRVEIFEAIVQERRVELAFEYHRLNDLRRWGLAEEVLAPFGFSAPKHRTYPIPQAELDNNPNLVQNPHY